MDLDPLPNNQNKEFWGDADVRGGLEPQEMHPGKHHFIRKSAREAQCTHCDWGLYLGADDVVKDGHIYDEKGKLIF